MGRFDSDGKDSAKPATAALLNKKFDLGAIQCQPVSPQQGVYGGRLNQACNPQQAAGPSVG